MQTRPVWKSVLLVAVCTIAMVTNVASANCVTVFLALIGRDLSVPENQLQWLVSAFALSSGCFYLLFGRIADVYGRKKVYIFGVLFLSAMSLGCGFAQTSTALFILRGMAGLGPAAFIPAALGVLAHAFPPSPARSIAFATFSAGAPVGGALGTQIGGLLTQYTKATWRSPFFLIAGITLLCGVCGIFAIDPDEPNKKENNRVDWFGGFLVTVGLVFVIFALSQGPVANWTGYVIALLVVGVFFIVLFLLWQHYLEKHTGTLAPPLMKLSLWSRAKGKFAVMQVIAFFQWSVFLSWSFWAQLYYEDYQKLSPILTAVRMLPMIVTGITCNFIVVLVIGRLDLVVLIAIGTLFTGIASLLFAVIDPSKVYWAFGFPAAITSVFGADFVFAAGTLFVAKVSLPEEQSLAGGVFQTLVQLGTSFGLAITTIVFNSVAKGAPDNAPLKAYKAAQWTAFGFAMFCTLLAIVFLRGVGPVGENDKPKVEDIEKQAEPVLEDGMSEDAPKEDAERQEKLKVEVEETQKGEESQASSEEQKIISPS